MIIVATRHLTAARGLMEDGGTHRFALYYQITDLIPHCMRLAIMCTVDVMDGHVGTAGDKGFEHRDHRGHCGSFMPGAGWVQVRALASAFNQMKSTLKDNQARLAARMREIVALRAGGVSPSSPPRGRPPRCRCCGC